MHVANEPTVVTIVLNWNGWLDTVECLESLLRSTYERHRIVVCDNGSQDESLVRLVEWADGLLEVTKHNDEAGRTWHYRPVHKPLTHVVYESIEAALREPAGDNAVTFIQTGANLGYAGGNNVGIRYAMERLAADYVWILNNDTVVDRSAIAKIVAFAQADSSLAAVGSRVLRYYDPARIQALGGGMFNPALARDTQIGRGKRSHPAAEQAIDLEHLIGASMFVRSAAIRDVGFMDESYFLYREETDWCITMRRRGWNLRYCPGSIVWHKEGRSTGFKSRLHDYYSVRNMLHLVRKFHPEKMPFAILASLVTAVLPKLVSLQLGRLGTVLRAHVDFARGIKHKSAIDPDALIRRTLRRR